MPHGTILTADFGTDSLARSAASSAERASTASAARPIDCSSLTRHADTAALAPVRRSVTPSDPKVCTTGMSVPRTAPSAARPAVQVKACTTSGRLVRQRSARRAASWGMYVAACSGSSGLAGPAGTNSTDTPPPSTADPGPACSARQ